jgi:predicted  nucleic acid-binding Zn-ribbon protein
VLDGLRQREEGEVQPPNAQLAEALWVVGNALLTNQGDCLAIQEQVEQLTKQVGLFNQQLRKALQEQPTAAGAVAAASAEAEGLSSSLASMQQQLNAVKQTADEASAFLQRAGLGREASAEKLKAALDEGSEASMKVSHLETAHGSLQGRVNSHDSELQRLKDQLARLEQQQQRQQQQQQQQQQHNPRAPEGAEIVVWAPADQGMEDRIAATLMAAARLSKGSVQYVACKFQRRSSAGGNGSGSGGDGSGAGSSAAAAAAAAAGGGSRKKEPLALYVVRLASSSLVPTVLGGRTRLFLRQQGAPMWLDKVLTLEERLVRKQQQSVARELRAKGVQTRWRGHILEERKERARGRFQWVQVPPPPPLPSSPPPPSPPSSPRGPTATDGMAGDVGAS